MTQLASRTGAPAVGHRLLFAAALTLSMALLSESALGQSFGSRSFGNQALGYAPQPSGDELFPADEALTPPAPGAADEDSAPVADRFKRAIVAYPSREAAGTVIVDTSNTYLYYVLGDNRAIRYGVGVGREGFTWAGVQSISRKTEWPDWHPPAEMIARQPYLPRFMAGGPGNPLGARAMYLGSSMYRIHGTNDPSTIGKFVSSGCIRLTNDDVADLFARVNVGTKVVVLPKSEPRRIEARSVPGRQAMTAPPVVRAVNLQAASLY